MADKGFAVGPDGDSDKYRLLRQVGGGGEAEIWQATLALAGEQETVAVKILRDVHAVDAEAWQERWSSQVGLLRLLRHPGVVGVHEYFVGPRLHQLGEADPQTRHHYLVMNWVEGRDLRQHEADWFESLRHLTQIADVLDWLHSGAATSSQRPVVHGDISPGNVVVNTDGQAVLVDFGLFRMAQDVALPPTGTQGYLAPEVLSAGEYTAASDRYGFGALAYFVLTGQNPPSDSAELRAALRRDLVPRLGSVDVAALESIVADDPDERPTAGQWMRTLWPHASTVVPREAPMPPRRPAGPAPVPAAAAPAGGTEPAPAARSRRPRLPWVLAGSAVALVAIVGVLALVFVALTESGMDGYAPETGAVEPIPPDGIPLSDPIRADGFDMSWQSPTQYVADCADDPWIEFALNRDFTSVSVSMQFTGGMNAAQDGTTFELLGDGERLDLAPADGYGTMYLSSDVTDIDVLRVEVTGASSGQCVVDQVIAGAHP